MKQMAGNDKSTGRRQLLLIATVFFAPLLLAWLMYLGVIDWRPRSISANGELFEPPLPLPAHAPEYLARVYPDEFLRQRWTLLYLGAGRCDKSCEQALLMMRQVRLSLGKYADRIGSAVILPTDGGFPEVLLPAFPNLEIVRAEPLSAIILEAHEARPGDWIYLVDPLGNLVMRFTATQDPRAIHNDLKRLLKLSRIG